MATAARKYDLYSDAFRADTYATFARMREQDPVLCQPGLDGETPIWFVTRYEDADAVLRDNARFVRDPRLALPPEQLRSGLPEFVAFIDLGKMDAATLSERSRAIVTFALCGFANFSSIAIQMAVTGGLAPNQRPVIASLGIRALLAGSLANLMSAALASLMLP